MAKITSISFDAPGTPSSETSEKPSPKPQGHYQRKVSVTYTRTEADLLDRLLLRLAANPQWAAEFTEPGVGIKTIQTRAKKVWTKTKRRIQERDQAQRLKEKLGDAYNPEVPGERDVPLF